MKNIIFPGLGLNLEINNVAFELLGKPIYWYACFFVLGFVIGILLAKKDDGKYSIKFEEILELMVITIPISIICARIYFILFKLDYYMENPSEIIMIQNGGLAIYGGVIGAIITIIIYSKIKKLKILDVLDYMAPFLAIRTMYRKMGKLL